MKFDNETRKQLLEKLKIKFVRVHDEDNFINFLKTSDLFEVFYKPIAEKPFENLNKLDIFLKLESEKELGLKKQYENSLYSILESALIIKAYPLFKDLLESFLNKSLEQVKFEPLILMYLIEINDVAAIEVYLQEKEIELLQENHSLASLKREVNILKKCKLDDKRIEYLKYRWAGYYCLINKEKMSTNEIFEYLLYAKSLEDFTLIYASCADHALREMIGIYIHEKYDVKDLRKHRIFRALDIVKGKNIKVELVKESGKGASHDQLLVNEKLLDDTNETPDEINTNKVIPLEKYVISTEEIQMLESIRKHEDLLIINIDMVISFISFQFYTVAEEILNQLEEDPNYYYLKSEIKYRSREFYESLYFANKALVEFELSDFDKAPFEYIKGLSYEQLGEFEEASKCFDLAVLLDATFKSARDKIT